MNFSYEIFSFGPYPSQPKICFWYIKNITLDCRNISTIYKKDMWMMYFFIGLMSALLVFFSTSYVWNVYMIDMIYCRHIQMIKVWPSGYIKLIWNWSILDVFKEYIIRVYIWCILNVSIRWKRLLFVDYFTFHFINFLLFFTI